MDQRNGSMTAGQQKAFTCTLGDIGKMDEYRRANDEYEGVFGL